MCVCVCPCMYTLRVVSMDKILYFINAIIIGYIKCESVLYSCGWVEFVELPGERVYI